MLIHHLQCKTHMTHFYTKPVSYKLCNVLLICRLLASWAATVDVNLTLNAVCAFMIDLNVDWLLISENVHSSLYAGDDLGSFAKISMWYSVLLFTEYITWLNNFCVHFVFLLLFYVRKPFLVVPVYLPLHCAAPHTLMYLTYLLLSHFPCNRHCCQPNTLMQKHASWS